jgi:hypothetical protein
MASTIKHKRSSVSGKVPQPGDLAAGELALNTADAKIYMKNDADTVVDITASIYAQDTNVTVSDTGSNGTITFTADGTQVGSMVSNQISLTQDTVIENAKNIKFKELGSNGSNYVSINAPDSLSASYTLRLPTATGTVNQVIKTDGAGNLDWGDVDTFGSNRIYVSAVKGDDANDGITAPVLTIKRGLQLASALVYDSNGIPNGTRINLIVSAGDYYIDNPVIIPDNVTVKGDSLRSVNIRPMNAGRDLLRVRNSTYFGEVTFRDGLNDGVPSYTFAYAVSFDDPSDEATDRDGYTNLPTTKPIITQSPYIQNCTLLSFLGASGVLVDGNLVTTPNDPFNQIEAENPVVGPAPSQGKSMVANAFTMISFGGTGWRVINDAYVQLVSCGYCSITNSATNFGLYALRASGYSPNAFEFDKGYIGSTGSSGSVQNITAFGWTRVNGPVEQFICRFYEPLSYDVVTCKRDVGYIIDAIGYDLMFGGNFRTISAGRSYLRSQASVVTTTQQSATITAFNYLKTELIAQDNADTAASTFIINNIDTINSIIVGGLNAVPETTLVDPDGYDVGYFNGRRLLVANTQFIKDEVSAYMAFTYNSIWSLLSTADKAKCTRDIGYIIEALTYDLTYGGNLETIVAARAYYNQLTNTLVEPGGQKTALLAVLARIKSVINSVVQGNLVLVTTGNTTAQDRSGTGGSAGAASFTDARIQEIYDYVNSITNTITEILPDTTWVNSSLTNIFSNFQSNKATTETAVTNYISEQGVGADLTSTFKNTLPTYLEVDFDASTDVDPTSDTFTIVAHGFINQDVVTYDADSNLQIGGLYSGDVFYVKRLTADTFQLYYDTSLTRLVDVTFVGSGTQYFRKQDFEITVNTVTDTHNTFQNVVLASGSGSGYSFTAGDEVVGTNSVGGGGYPCKGFVYSYDSTTRTLVLCINTVTIGLTETRNLFDAGTTISLVDGASVSYTVSSVTTRTDLYGATFDIASTLTGGQLTNTTGMPGKRIWFHRPSITNSSGHTWEYAGSGTDYNALPQNGGKGIPAYEQVAENGGQVYTSGTNELGDFKVGNFITAYNRTGNVTFTNKITVDTLDVLRLGVGGVTVESISTDIEMGNSEPGGPKDSRISTQLAVYTYTQDHLGNVLDKNVSTNAIPGSLVQLNSNGQINSDLIPTSRSFTNFSSGGLDSRLYQVDDVPANDMLAGDIATETFQQQELTLSDPITANVGTAIFQTTGNTATTAITSGSNSFTVTHSGAVTVPRNSYVLLEGVTPSTYNGVWLVNRSSAGSFEVFSSINPGVATVQGTIYYGGASGRLKSSYTSATSIIVGSVGTSFNTAFTNGVNTLIIGTDRTPSDTNGTVTVSTAPAASSSTGNYFLRTSVTGQYLILDASMNPTYTNGSISKAFRYSNNAYVTTTTAHNFTSGNAVKIDAGTASFDGTQYVTVTSTTEFYYSNTASDSSTSASTTATATLAGASSATTMTGSVTSAALTGTITLGDFVFDVAGTIPKGSKITAVNMSVNPRTFTITFPSASTVASTSSAELKFFTPATETGTVRSVVTAADSLSQGEFTEYRSGVVTVVNNFTGLTGGSGYTNGTYYRVPLTSVTGTGVCALADITVATGAVTNVDLVFGGAGYAINNILSASTADIGAGAGFQITVSAVEKRVYLNLTGGQTFVATSGAPDFVEHNASVVATFTATTTLTATFDARSTGAGGGVDTVTNRITTSSAHGFGDGDPVQYNPGTDPALGGLITNNVYYVKVINSTTVELYSNYNLGSIMIISSSTGSGHTLTRKAVDIVNNTFSVPAHGFVTGDAFRILGPDLPYESSVQIAQNTFWFVGSVTTNSFTVHALRADALSSIAGIVLGEGNLTATGSGTITVVKASIKVTGTVNTSSQARDNWNSLVTTNIDASNIISGIVSTSRLATGSANSYSFLRGDSTWATAVQSAQLASNSALTLTGNGASPFYGALTFDVNKVNVTGGSGGFSTTGVASFNTTQFAVGLGDTLAAGAVQVKAGVIDAGTLQTRNLAYVLDSANHTTQPVSVGGTGLVTYTTGDMLYASATTTLNKLTIGVAGTVMTSSGSAPQWSSGLTVAEDVSITGADLTTTSTAQTMVFNTNTKSVSIGGAATSIAIGSNTATEAFTSNVKSYTTGGASSITVTANLGLGATISTVARSSNTATVVTTVNHGLTTGDTVTIVCLSDASYNTVGSSVTVSDATTFTYSNAGSNIGTAAGTGTVYIGAVGLALGTTTATSDTWLAFSSSPVTAGVRAGMLVQGSSYIPANTVVTGLDGNRVYLSQAVTGIIAGATPIAFTDTCTSMGIKTGDQVTIATSGITNVDGTWPVTTAGANSITFAFNITTAATANNTARAGTIVKNSTLLLKNRNVIFGSSEASGTPVGATLKGENGVGTNIAGASLTIQGGLASGSGTNGSIIFRTGTTGSSGTTQATSQERMTIASSSSSTTLDLTTTKTTANVFNTTATTVSAFGVAATLNIANTASATTTGGTINIGTNGGGAQVVTLGSSTRGALVQGTTTFTVSGTAAGAGTYTGLSHNSSGTAPLGSGGTFNVTTTGAGTYSTVATITIATGGTSYYVGQTLTILGTSLGGATPTNDLTLVVATAVNSNNTLAINSTATGTTNITTPVTTGTGNIFTGITGTTRIGASGTIQLGISASATTTVQVGGAITGNTLKVAGTTTGTINLTTDVTSGTANIFTSVTGTVNIGALTSTSSVGTLALNSQNYNSSAETAGITTATVVSSFAIATYRSAKYILQVSCTAGTDSGAYQVSEVLVIHNGSTAQMVDYGVVKTGASLVVFTAAVNGANLELTATPTAGDTIKVRVVRTLNTI